MSQHPRVTVLMACFNERLYLHEAVQSVLSQSFGDFELLIIDDGSTDGSTEWLSALREPRLRLVRHATNRGLTHSLTEGLEIARGRYVARMDADDVALPDRLERQVTFLEAQPAVGLLGACILARNAQGVETRPELPLNDLDIRWTCLLASPFAHPTVMFRRELFASLGLTYDERFVTAQDYDLWSRALRHVRGANLAEPLLRYRVRCGRSAQRRAEQLANHDLIALRTIREQFPELHVTQEQVSAMRSTFAGGGTAADVPILHTATLYLDMLACFSRRHSGEEGMAALRRRELRRAADLVFCQPASWSWARTTARLLSADFGLIRRPVGHLCRSLLRGGREKRSRKDEH